MAVEPIYDELLVLRSQDGDRRALEELVGRWQGRFVRAATRHTGEPEAARDAVQEAWLAILRGLSRLDDPARFGPWAHRIVRNKAIDWVRGRGRRRRMDRDLAELPPPIEEGERAGVADRSERGALVEALGDLSAAQRVLLSLFYREGFSVGEIAELLEIPAGTVKSRLHRARNQLKRALEGERDERPRRQDS